PHGLENESRTQLNHARCIRARGLAELRVVQIVVNTLQVDAIQYVEELESQLEIHLVIEEMKTVIFDHAGVDIDEPRIAIGSSFQGALCARSRNHKGRGRRNSVNVLLA